MQQTRPIKGGHIYIKKNFQVLLKPIIIFPKIAKKVKNNQVFEIGPKIAVDELCVHTLVQIYLAPIY